MEAEQDVVVVCCGGQDSHTYSRLWDRVGVRVFWQGHKGKPLVCLCSVSYSDCSLTFMIIFQVCHELEYL